MQEKKKKERKTRWKREEQEKERREEEKGERRWEGKGQHDTGCSSDNYHYRSPEVNSPPSPSFPLYILYLSRRVHSSGTMAGKEHHLASYIIFNPNSSNPVFIKRASRGLSGQRVLREAVGEGRI